MNDLIEIDEFNYENDDESSKINESLVCEKNEI